MEEQKNKAQQEQKDKNRTRKQAVRSKHLKPAETIEPLASIKYRSIDWIKTGWHESITKGKDLVIHRHRVEQLASVDYRLGKQIRQLTARPLRDLFHQNA